MNVFKQIKSIFGRRERKEVVIPSGPRLSGAQSIQYIRQRLDALTIDEGRLELARDASTCFGRVRFKSEYYRHSWDIFGPGDADRHLAINQELQYQYHKELDELDPHPDFDLMHPKPSAANAATA